MINDSNYSLSYMSKILILFIYNNLYQCTNVPLNQAPSFLLTVQCNLSLDSCYGRPPVLKDAFYDRMTFLFI